MLNKHENTALDVTTTKNRVINQLIYALYDTKQK